jgi:hypothetical protein
MVGYSKAALVQKLGIKPGMRVLLLRMPTSILRKLQPLPEGITLLSKFQPATDYIHYFAEDYRGLETAMPKLRAALAKNGLMWISWRKGRVNTDLNEGHVRKLALKNGIVDVKVCAIDEKWSGLKFVYRLKDR